MALKSLLLGLTIPALFVPMAWGKEADETPLQNLSDASVAETATDSNSSWAIKPEAQLVFGSTTNATLLAQPTAGTYAKLSPSMGLELNPSDTVSVSVNADASLKRFSDRTVDPIASETIANFREDGIWSASDRWEFGENGSFGYVQSHIPVVGASSVEAIEQRYYEPFVRIYGAWLGDAWTFESGLGAGTRRYSTTTFDTLGNVFHNSYSSFKGDASAAFRFSPDTRIKLSSTFEQRGYSERMGEFSDGVPVAPGAQNPIYSLFAQEYDAQVKTKLSSVIYAPSLSVRFEKDQVYGARDSTTIRLKQKASIPLPLKLVLDPEVSIAHRGYDHFRSDPLGDPRSSPLRVDWLQAVAASLKYSVSAGLSAQARYAFNRELTNYSLEGYQEHVVETGMNVRF